MLLYRNQDETDRTFVAEPDGFVAQEEKLVGGPAVHGDHDGVV